MNRILFLSTAPPPALDGTDAMFQDIQLLIDRFGGLLMSIYPLRTPSRFVPHWLMGLHNASALKSAMKHASLIHVFSATLKPLPCIRNFKGPIIYTVTASTGEHITSSWFNRHRVTVVVNNAHDAERLRNKGVNQVAMILPGMALSHLTYTPVEINPFKLMVGSAPWTKAQFKTKGIDALLSAVQEIPELNLVLLWRKWWYDEIVNKVKSLGLESRVEIFNEWKNVNEVLAGCHAATVLAEHNRLVKAWPHSAIESLAAGKPALLSRVIPMAEFVEKNRAGAVVNSLDPRDVILGIRELMRDYDSMNGSRLQTMAATHFDASAMLTAYDQLYGKVGT
ncbi:MAG TPA: glycosyltransferase [Kiritimatiellia bacterium]|nr:glycosyltransferase [Kiritimatiellia bacterium]